MKNHKIYLILSAFSKSDWLLFDKFVHSPAHNKHEDVRLLFSLLKKRMRAGEKGLEKEFLFESVFPEASFDPLKFNHLISYLFKILESFLAWQEWESSEGKDLYLMRAYYKRRQEKPFRQLAKKTKKEQEKTIVRDSNFLKNEYHFELEQFNAAKIQQRAQAFNLQEVSDGLDVYFIADKLKIACILLSHQSVVKKEYDHGLLAGVLSYVHTQTQLLEIPAIAIYYYAFQAQTNLEEVDYFYAFKKELEDHSSSFTATELRDIFLLAVNYCIKKVNTGQPNFLEELFEIYKAGLAREVFVENGVFSRFTYNNIIIAGLKLKAFDWVKTFIYGYKEKLESSHRESSFSYNLSKYYFEIKEYEKAQILLLQMEYDDVLHNLGAKTMLLKIYFEKDEWDALDNLLASFKNYIYRKKVLGYHRENYLNIIQFTQKLMNLNRNDKQQVKFFQEEISAKKILTERAWFFQYITKA